MRQKLFIFLSIIGLILFGYECKKLAHDNTSLKHPKPLAEYDGCSIVVTSGSYSGSSCGQSLPCGPCGGLCIQFAIQSHTGGDTVALSSSDYNAGQRRAYMSLLDDNHVKIQLVDSANVSAGIDGSGNRATILTANYDIGTTGAGLLGKTNVTLLGGTYTIDYTTNPKGDIVFSATTY